MPKLAIGIIVLILVLLGVYVAADQFMPKEQDVTDDTMMDEENDAPAQVVVDYSDETDLIAGEWQSLEDEKSFKVFNADGTMVERYIGESAAESEGEWMFFTADDQVGTFTQPANPDLLYLRVSSDGEYYHYIVSELDETSLELTYLDRGGVLMYKRVVEDPDQDIQEPVE